jgi:hypothetical protein
MAGCKSREERLEEQIGNLEIHWELTRFDRIFATSSASDLPTLRKDFPYLFSMADSVYLAKMQDTLIDEIFREVDMAFGDLAVEEERIHSLLQHLKYYYPDKTLPDLVTFVNEVRYPFRIAVGDSLWLVALDNYLGPDHRFYESFPKYLRAELDARYIPLDLSEEWSRTVIPTPKGRTFLEKMVYQGKQLYVAKRLVPAYEPWDLFRYTEEQWNWAEANEAQIWSYFIEKELLFSTDPNLDRRFLDRAPFSRFQLELDNESPGRIGRYIGYKIVAAYMQKERPSLEELAELDAQTLFRKYKPKRPDGD